jgi:hypothetical protein
MVDKPITLALKKLIHIVVSPVLAGSFDFAQDFACGLTPAKRLKFAGLSGWLAGPGRDPRARRR